MRPLTNEEKEKWNSGTMTTQEQRNLVQQVDLDGLYWLKDHSSPSHNIYKYIVDEINARQARPHWTVLPTFWIGIAILVLTILSVVIALVQ